jgi:hypothetical protein
MREKHLNNTVQVVFDPHVRSAIICSALSLVGLGVGWVVDQIHKDTKK